MGWVVSLNANKSYKLLLAWERKLCIKISVVALIKPIILTYTTECTDGFFASAIQSIILIIIHIRVNIQDRTRYIQHVCQVFLNHLATTFHHENIQLLRRKNKEVFLVLLDLYTTIQEISNFYVLSVYKTLVFNSNIVSILSEECINHILHIYYLLKLNT